jgi:hypothetical protein
MSNGKELPIPSAAATDAKSAEIVRMWVAKGAQHVSLAAGLWADPKAWGIVLVDLARHVARAYAQTRGMDPGIVMKQIREGLDAEWAQSTDDGRGSIVS